MTVQNDSIEFRRDSLPIFADHSVAFGRTGTRFSDYEHFYLFMNNSGELSEKEKHNFEEFLILTFEFSDDELAAIDKQKPMTMELFSSCLAKCTEHGLYKLFERLLDEYPELSDKYVKAIEDDIKDVVLPERTPEEEEESWNRLCERIKKEYGDDLTCE